MATPVKDSAILQRTVTTAVAANNPVTLALTPNAPSGQSCIVDWVQIGFNGNTQVIASWNIQDAGGGSVYTSGYVTNGVAGFGSQHFDFPGGLRLPAAQAVELSIGALTNCAIRASAGFHHESAI